jgi:hypothetical protein
MCGKFAASGDAQCLRNIKIRLQRLPGLMTVRPDKADLNKTNLQQLLVDASGSNELKIFQHFIISAFFNSKLTFYTYGNCPTVIVQCRPPFYF